jgi:hypothetical protein
MTEIKKTLGSSKVPHKHHSKTIYQMIIVLNLSGPKYTVSHIQVLFLFFISSSTFYLLIIWFVSY